MVQPTYSRIAAINEDDSFDVQILAKILNSVGFEATSTTQDQKVNIEKEFNGVKFMMDRPVLESVPFTDY